MSRYLLLLALHASCRWPRDKRSSMKLSRASLMAVILLAWFAGPSMVWAQGDASGSKRIRQLLADLDSSDFATREAAGKQLRAMGTSAFASLSQAASGPSAEVSQRALEILGDGSKS